MKQLFVLLATVMSVSFLQAQVDSIQSNNPFEIPGRGVIVTLTDFAEESVEVETVTGNPFEVTTYREEVKEEELYTVSQSLSLPSWLPKPSMEASAENDTTLKLVFTAIVLLLSIALMIQFLPELKEAFGTIIQFNLIQQLARQDSSTVAFSFLYGLFIVLLSWLAYNFLQHFEMMPAVALWFRPVFILLGLGILIGLRRALIALVGVVFQTEKNTRLFLFQELVAAACILVPLLVCVLLSTFGPEGIRLTSLYIGLGLVGFVFVYTLLRGLMILTLSTEFSIIRFLSYLCAVEIAPAVLLLKFWFVWST